MKENQVKYCQCNLCHAMAGTIWFHMTFHKTTISFDDAFSAFSHYPTAHMRFIGNMEIWRRFVRLQYWTYTLHLNFVQSTVLVHGVHAHVFRKSNVRTWSQKNVIIDELAWHDIKILFGIISSLRCGVWSSYVGLVGYGCPTMIRKQLNQLDPFDELITLQSCQEIYINIAFDSVMFGSYLYNIISRCRYTIAAVDCMCSCSSGLHVCWGLFRQSEYWYPIFDTSRLPVAIPGPTMMSFLVYRSLYSLG